MARLTRPAVALWRALGSIRLTVALCFLLAIDLGIGYLSLRGRLEIFVPMSNIGLLEWLATYGAANPLHALWFFVMLALLGALSINTFVCTSERVIVIVAQRPGWRQLPFRLAPHLMHYAVLVILSGYLCSYLFSTSDTGHTLRPGETLTLPDRTTLRFEDFAAQYLRGRRVEAFDGYIIRPNARLTVHRAGRQSEALLNFNEALHVGDYGIYLADFQPRKPGGGMGRNYIALIVRRDPSAIVYRLGMALFVAGLALYIFERRLKR